MRAVVKEASNTSSGAGWCMVCCSIHVCASTVLTLLVAVLFARLGPKDA